MSAPMFPSSSGSVEALAEKLQQHWQGGGHAYTRPWNNETDKDCVHGLPGQAEFFRQLARIAIGGVAQASPGPREVLDALADKVSAKIAQLEHYKANDAQLDHAKTIAEGRISQANQILHWIAEAAIQHSPSVPSTDREGGK